MKKRINRSLRISRYVIYKETLIDFQEHFWSFTGAFVGIAIIAFFQSFILTKEENIFLIGSFGASSVLVYGAIQSPLAQPRNLILGNLICAAIGVSVAKFLPDVIWITAPLSVGLSIVGMQMSKALHPPGGATALIAVIGSEKIQELGYLYVLTPVLAGSLILFFVALVFNNITKHRRYPGNGRIRNSIKKIMIRKYFLK